MKINDTKNLLKEKAEEVLDDMLEEMEKPTEDKEPKEVEAPEAAVKSDLEDEHVGEAKELEPSEGKENEEAPKGVTSEVEASVEAEHASEGEEVSEVVVKEESVEKSLEDDHIGEDSELEPDQGKENEEAEHEDEKAVDADLEAEHVGEGEEIDTVEGKENEEAPKADKAEVEATLDADHAEEKKDVEGVVVKEEEISEDTLETDPAAEEAKEEYGTVAKDADIGEEKPSEEAEETAEKVDELLKDEPEDELLENNMKSIFDLIESINASLAESEEPVVEKKADEACPCEAAKEVEAKAEDDEVAKGEEVKEVIVKEDETLTEKPVVGDENGDNRHWEDEKVDLKKTTSENHSEHDGIKVVSGHTEDGKTYVQGETDKDEEKLKAKAKDLKEDSAANVGDPVEKEFDVDAVIATPEVAEMGTEENEKHIEAEEKENEVENKPEAETIKESVHYTSLKEACMLDEGYFAEDTYIVESAESKQTKLVEQVAVLMAREEGDPLYEELITAAIRLERLQEAIVNKYHDEAADKAGIIMEGISTKGKGDIKIGNGNKISGSVGNGNNSKTGKASKNDYDDVKTDGKGDIELKDKNKVEGSVGNGNNQSAQ